MLLSTKRLKRTTPFSAAWPRTPHLPSPGRDVELIVRTLSRLINVTSRAFATSFDERILSTLGILAIVFYAHIV